MGVLASAGRPRDAAEEKRTKSAVTIERVKLIPIGKTKSGISSEVRSAHEQGQIQEHKNVLVMSGPGRNYKIY